jgi:hypothetical protein
VIDGNVEVVTVIAALAVERHRALDECARLRAEVARLTAELDALKPKEPTPKGKKSC